MIWITLILAILSCKTNTELAESNQELKLNQDTKDWIRINDSIQYSVTFKALEEESDVGIETLKVVSRGKTLWQLVLKEEIMLTNSSNAILLDINQSTLEYLSWNDGEEINSIKLPHILSDANEFISLDQGLFVKLIDEDYKTDRVLLVEQLTSDLVYFDLENKEYSTMKIMGNGLYLVNQEDKKTLILDLTK